MVETAATEKRVLAFLVDRVIEGILYLPVWLQLALSYLREGEASVSWRVLVACMLLHLCYDCLFLYFLGGTVGKLLFGLRVVPRREPMNDLTFFQSLLRPLADRLSFFFGQALHVLALLRFDRTHVSDWIAETWVVQNKPRRRRPVRRLILATILFFALMLSSFLRFYRGVQAAHMEDGRIIFTAPEADSPSAES